MIWLYRGPFPIGLGVYELIVWLVFIGLIIWGAFRIFRRNVQVQGQYCSALDIAKERYAKGEIDAKQFEQLKKNLS